MSPFTNPFVKLFIRNFRDRENLDLDLTPKRAESL